MNHCFDNFVSQTYSDWLFMFNIAGSIVTTVCKVTLENRVSTLSTCKMTQKYWSIFYNANLITYFCLRFLKVLVPRPIYKRAYNVLLEKVNKKAWSWDDNFAFSLDSRCWSPLFDQYKRHYLFLFLFLFYKSWRLSQSFLALVEAPCLFLLTLIVEASSSPQELVEACFSHYDIVGGVFSHQEPLQMPTSTQQVVGGASLSLMSPTLMGVTKLRMLFFQVLMTWFVVMLVSS